jgi:ribulose-5-phosphate 4-epimerase/fuculose-1-phosphate aldolase
VVHAHPPAVVLCSMAGIELRPIYGGYDPSSMRLSLKGIPVYPNTLTLNTKDQVHAMQKVMGASDVCILRGHGLIVVGNSVEQANITAIKVDTLARMNLQAASLGKVPAIPDADIEQFQHRTGRGNSSPEGLWRYYCEWLIKG